MNRESKKNSSYSPIDDLIGISENCIKKLNKSQTKVKIRSIIIMCSTVTLSVTLLRPIITLSLIGSSVINIGQAYYLKRKSNNINIHKKTIGQINKYLNLEQKLNRKHSTSLDRLIFNSEHRNDLYNCIWTNDIDYLQTIIKKYETKFEEALVILNKNKNDDKTTSNKTTIESTNNQLITKPYYQTDNQEQNIKGCQYVKKYY